MSNIELAKKLLPLALGQTLFMVFFATLFAAILALPLGVILFRLSDKKLYKALSFIVNIGRSFPFAILMITLIPFTKFLLGTSLGTTAAIIPLTIAAVPFLARLIEQNLREISPSLVRSMDMMGASFFQIVTKVLLPEALPSLISSVTTTSINLINYSTMAGIIGGGGLGQIAMQYGYQRFNTFILTGAVLFLIVLVECTQRGGNALVHKILKRRGLCED